MTLHFYATFVLVYDLLLIFAFSHKVVPVHFKSDWNLCKQHPGENRPTEDLNKIAFAFTCPFCARDIVSDG